jgi:hypothetical protein
MTQTQLSQETEPMESAAASTSANWERRGSAKHSQPRPPLVDHPTTHKVRGWLVAKRISLAWAVPLLAITAIVRLINLGGSPQRVDDEGTYVARTRSAGSGSSVTTPTGTTTRPSAGSK